MSASDEVVVVGAGPVGLWVAAELALAGVPVTVLEQREERSPHSKALGVHARTLEIFGMRGLAEQFLAEGRPVPDWHFGMLTTRIDLRPLATEYPFMLALPQRRTEELLEKHAVGLGVTVLRGRRVTGLDQDQDRVTLTVDGPDGSTELTASFVVGADGARSTIRAAAGIGFPGTEPTAYGFIGEVVLDEPPAGPAVSRHSADGAIIAVPLGAGRYRVTGIDAANQGPDDILTFEALREITVKMLGTDLGMRDPSWLTRFPDRTRLAETYRRGRVLLAGDAAHITWPAGGVGLNVGVQDAMNLGWKLAAEVQGRAAPGLLDSYHAERHPIGADLSEHTLAQGALITGTSVSARALRSLLSDLLAEHPELNRSIAEKLSGLEVAYPSPDSLTGRRAHSLLTPEGGKRLSKAMASGQPVLVQLAGPDWIRTFDLPVVDLRGSQDAKLGAVLVRPDGHVCRVVQASDAVEADVAVAVGHEASWADMDSSDGEQVPQISGLTAGC